ncbi:MAG: DUF3142 domain-containing protein [Alphaproteobacteria bacterium]
MFNIKPQKKIAVKASLFIFLCLLLVVGGWFGVVWVKNPPSYSTAYWLWAGITEKDVPPNSSLYIYQGHFLRSGAAAPSQAVFTRHGLYPYPLKAPAVFLVYRLMRLPDETMLLTQFYEDAAKWQLHGVLIKGVQLDFDSPTSGLLLYGDFLEKLRKLLPPAYGLSLTGLGDWAINGDRQALGHIADVSDELVFQLYEYKTPLADINIYLQKLASYPFPYKIGVLPDPQNPSYIQLLQGNPNFRGVIYFIQKNNP